MEKCDTCGQERESTEDEFVARRSEIYQSARALIKRMSPESEVEHCDVLYLARFLAGDDIPGE